MPVITVEPTCLFCVRTDMRYPLPASPGEVLGVFRGTPNLMVFDRDLNRVLSERAYREDRIWQTVTDLVTFGFVEPLDAFEAARFLVPPRPVLVPPPRVVPPAHGPSLVVGHRR